MSPPVHFERVVWSGDQITPGLLAQAIEILLAAFPRWPPFEVPVAPVEHLSWKLAHPGWAPSSLVAEMVDGVMAGVTLRLHRRFRVGGVARQARDWVDHCLHPVWQERGIYSRLAGTWKEQRSEYDFGVWSTNHPKVMRATRTSEPRSIELGSDLRSWVLPLAPAAVLAQRGDTGVPQWRRELLSRAATAGSRLRRRMAPTPAPTPREPTVGAVDRFDDRFPALFEAIASELDLVQERTPVFLSWRYLDPRAGRYTVLAADDGDGLAGFVALGIADGVGRLMDLVARPGDPATPQALVAAAIDSMRAAGVDAVVCRASRRSALAALLPRLGFVDARIRTGYSIASGRETLASLRFLADRDARVHLMLGDIDWA